MRIATVPLENRFVRLEPFEDGLKAEVRAALDCDSEAWDIMVAPAYGAHFDHWWDSALSAMQAGTRIAYAVRRTSDDAVVGTTSLYEINPAYRRCEIGSTFYRPEVRGGAIIRPASGCCWATRSTQGRCGSRSSLTPSTPKVRPPS